MPFYEHVFLARQDLTTAQVETLTEGFTKVLVEGKGQVAGSEYWGLRTLAYRIAKNRKAHYVMLNIDAPAAAVAEMDEQIAESKLHAAQFTATLRTAQKRFAALAKVEERHANHYKAQLAKVAA